MKQLLKSDTVEIPEGVQAKASHRVVTITGPRGTLHRSFRHMNIDVYLINDGRKIKVDCWFANKKQAACVRTICSMIQNLVTGVTKGYKYHMKLVYAHFPINAYVPAGGKAVEIKNFLGQRRVKRVEMLEGVTIEKPENLKDELVISGNDIDAVSLSCALINQKNHVRAKDIRKFLDGIYINQKLNVVEDE